MTDTLGDLLRESVADADMPDRADAAWRSAVRARRRRSVATVAGVAATALVAGGVAWAVGQHRHDAGAAPVHQPSRTPASGGPSAYRPGSGGYDARYHGVPVWWSPRLAQESTLPAYVGAPLPATIDVTDVGREIAPASSATTQALAAFAVVGDAADHVASVGVVGPDGQVRLVDTARVEPMTDPEGNPRVDVRSSMLSPTGEFLMFPQEHSILVLTLATGQWRTIRTGADPTWAATWSGDRTIALPPSSTPGDPTAPVPAYSVTGGRLGDVVAGSTPGVPVGSSQPFGPDLASAGATYRAQAYGAGADIAQPPALHLSPGQSDWISVGAEQPAILVMPQEPGRQKQCCPVATWLSPDSLAYESRSSGDTRLLAWRVGTADFYQVSAIVGVRPGMALVSSYARLDR